MTCWLEVGSYTTEDEERVNGDVAEESRVAEDMFVVDDVGFVAEDSAVGVAEDSGAGYAGSMAVIAEDSIEDEDAMTTSEESQMDSVSSCSVRAMLSSVEETALSLSPQALIMATTAVMGKMSFLIDIGNLFF